MPGCSVCALPFLALCDDMLTMFACATRWLSLHLYTLAYMAMHESCLLVSRPCFNTIKSWTFDPNLHLSLVDTTFCFAFLLVFPFVCVFAFSHAMLAISLIFICFMPLSYALYAFSFHCLSTGFLSLPLHVRTWYGDA